jgi:hypothetical protein
MRPPRSASRSFGQALVEFALVFPIFALLLFGVIVLGLGVFYQQQLTNATREAARYASIHSATAQCPTVATLDPVQNVPTSYYRCDPPPAWPLMTAAARHAAWGLDTAAINVAACWSGWVTQQPGAGSPPAAGSYDAPPPGTYDIAGTATTVATTWAPCSIGGVQDPQDNSSQIACGSNLQTIDTSSDQSDRTGVTVANTVTVFACFRWSPPMAGFLLIPTTVTQTAVITEPIERQQ